MTTPDDKPVEVNINPAVYRLDVSQRALSLARKIDRLPPGIYLIELEKMASAPTELHRIQRVVTVEDQPVPVNYNPE